jgi:hypothetical protein
VGVSQHKIVYLLSIKSGKDILPIEDNCLEEERSDNYYLRSVVLNVPDAYDVFCAIRYLLQSIHKIGNLLHLP